MKKVFAIMALIMLLTGCEKADLVNYNIRREANNFNVYRRVVAINTRLNETLFAVEGYISVDVDDDGDLNVTIQTGEDEFKLFYAHLGNDVTYTVIQTEPSSVTPYAYNISFFPAREVLEHGLFDVTSSERKEE
jgi:hypothetical protein